MNKAELASARLMNGLPRRRLAVTVLVAILGVIVSLFLDKEKVTGSVVIMFIIDNVKHYGQIKECDLKNKVA